MSAIVLPQQCHAAVNIHSLQDATTFHAVTGVLGTMVITLRQLRPPGQAHLNFKKLLQHNGHAKLGPWRSGSSAIHLCNDHN